MSGIHATGCTTHATPWGSAPCSSALKSPPPRAFGLLLAISFGLIAACASTPADAQSWGSKGGFLAGGSTSKSDYAALPKGDSITSGGHTYTVLSDVRALPTDPGQEPAGLNVLERKGRFVVYRETRPEMKSPSAITAQDAGLGTSAAGQPLLTHAVVLNSSTGRVGIVMGTIIVKLADMSQADALGAARGLTLSSRFDHLNLAIYTAAPGQDIAVATAALRADPRVTSADPEDPGERAGAELRAASREAAKVAKNGGASREVAKVAKNGNREG